MLNVQESLDSRDWRDVIRDALGSSVRTSIPVSGGDIGQSLRVELDDGRSVFVKRYPGACAGLAEAEAHGLEWLARPNALRVARPIAHGEDWIVLEWIESAPAAPDYPERLGRGLARLHEAAPSRFGLEHDGWLATIPQSNRPHEIWARFYAEERLLPLTERASEQGLLPLRARDRLRALCDQMECHIGPPEPPARLHGDLWSGNVLCDERGHPCLIDPAAYAGHREVDLAMMALFGGFPRSVFDAYTAESPLAPGAAGRIPLYQLWPLLAHVCLFGRSYLGRVEACLDAVLDRGRPPA